LPRLVQGCPRTISSFVLAVSAVTPLPLQSGTLIIIYQSVGPLASAYTVYTRGQCSRRRVESVNVVAGTAYCDATSVPSTTCCDVAIEIMRLPSADAV